jgi:hypothetical protein
MRVLVATGRGQGLEEYDVCETIEGELVVLHQGDPTCWVCRRSMIGLVSGRETTTFAVEDRPEIDRAMYRAFLRDGLVDIGIHPAEPAGSDERWLDRLYDQMVEVADYFAPREVLQRVDGEFSVRLPDPSNDRAA